MSEILSMKQELSAAAAKRLRSMIIEQAMRPGDRLPSENSLVQMFGVGRSTVREAIKLLTAENVVEIQRGKGTFITMQPGLIKDPLGLDFTNQAKLLDNLLETRMMIEPQIAFLAAQRANQRNLEQLAGIIRKIEETGNDKRGHTPFDVAFHQTVAECTQNDVLHRILPIICESIQEGYFISENVPGSFERAIQSHINIYEAIKAKNSEAAKLETQKHIRQTMEDAETFGGEKK
jgi:GntR family transcriptional regulator, transcriptional repressor for pyruvate dehydrogenase complex